MMNKLSIDALILLEKKYQLWNHKLFEYPLWIHCREPLLSTGMMVERRITKPTVKVLFKSFLGTIHFLLTQYKYDKVFFLMERAELLEIYKEEKSKKKLLFLNPEQEKVYEENDYISSDFFSSLRFISRKVAFIVFYKKYKSVISSLEILGYGEVLRPYIKVAMGDAFFLKFLSFILRKKSQKIYTGAVIPMGEKFVNALNSYEVQHGVIHASHIGYVGLPKVQNTLLLYSKRYVTILDDMGYKGSIAVNEYKKNFFEKKSNRYFPIVIYTQPTIQMQKAINTFFKKFQPKDVFIQKHPKDYFPYEINAKYFVNATIPLEVGCPILYISSIIENFTLYDRQCYIYDLHYANINLEKFLQIYTKGSSSKMIIKDTLVDIYELIKKEEQCLK